MSIPDNCQIDFESRLRLSQFANEYDLLLHLTGLNILPITNDHNCITVCKCGHVTDLVRLIAL